VSEVATLKVHDIDSERMLLRVERARAARIVTRCSRLRCRSFYAAGGASHHPKAWLFPGQDPLQPISTRQLNRACHAAAHMAEITKRVLPHTLRHSSPRISWSRTPISE
jgi:site-specific recombinase XerD